MLSRVLKLFGAAASAEERRQQLRDAEEYMKSVVDHVVDGIITIDASGVIETFNPAAEGIFGYARSEVIGKNVTFLMPDPHRVLHETDAASYLATGDAKTLEGSRELVGRRKDGSTFPLELAISEFHVGSRRFFTGIVRDITDRKRL